MGGRGVEGGVTFLFIVAKVAVEEEPIEVVVGDVARGGAAAAPVLVVGNKLDEEFALAITGGGRPPLPGFNGGTSPSVVVVEVVISRSLLLFRKFWPSRKTTNKANVGL